MAWWPWLLVQLVVWCCAGLVAVLWWKWATRPQIDAPGPPTLPIIGNILNFLEMPVTLHKMFDLHHQYGNLVRLYVGPMLLVMVAHPDDVQHILLTSKLVDRGAIVTNLLRPFAGVGLINIDASRWKLHRKLINPTFHSQLLEGFLEAFHDGGLFVSERLARTRGAATDVHPPVFLAAIHNFCSTIMGMNHDLIPDATRAEELSAAVSDGLITVQVMNLLIGGTETVSVTVSYVLTLLALHPEWQDAAHQELKDVFGEGDDYLRAPSLADLGRLRVLESIIKETLRLFPMVPILPRVATEEVWLSGGSPGSVLVPKGALLFVMPLLTHRLPQFFPDPQRFDPSRFLEDRVRKEHVCSYLPFGLGARNCVGSQYGRLQLKVYLADILRRFRFLPCSRLEDLENCALSLSLNPIKPIRVSCMPLGGPST
ncbi:cytochrome P450 4C1-like isoform X3 [Schistocerca piceifrons]|uniref:cytochrome P450 4C1-like isoform X3 n=1 Tax=Schistocerca piceifrons TaxID=274613 RepID=UPI001F5F248C|nr:cytochrome P450 4C1-like isoform X3 [Schistocerca piceifrons]